MSVATNSAKKPSQIRFKRPAQMSLFAKIYSYPPLGEVTLVSADHGEVSFQVLLETSQSLPEEPWDVTIHHNATSTDQWVDLPLQRSTEPPIQKYGNSSMSNIHSYVFTGSLRVLQRPSSTSFTIKYRTNAQAEWQWVNDQFGASDGLVVFQSHQERKHLSAYLDIPSESDLEVDELQSQSPGATLWSIVDSTQVTSGSEKTKSDRILGTPVDLLRYLSLVRIWTPWLGPRHGQRRFRLTEDAVLCSFLNSHGISLVVLAISGLDNVTATFKSDSEGRLIVSSRADGSDRDKHAFKVLAAAAEDPEQAVAAVMYEARRLVKDTATEPQTMNTPVQIKHYSADSDTVVVEKGPNPQWLENWYDGLAYCTWNGLGQNLTEAKIIDALQSLQDNSISVSNLIIDDNWQSLDNKGESQFHRGWMSFEANKEGFPHGLRHTTRLIRDRFPNIEHIAVWHALLGYWGGISPQGEIAKTYKTKLVEKEAGVAGGTMLAVDPEDVRRFYDDFYYFLSSAGIDSVKTDAQFFLDLLVDSDDRRRFTNAYQDAWEIAYLRYLGAKAISCMSQTPQIIFHSLLSTTGPRILLRNSDDFFPEVPTSHPWHVFCNAHNSILTQHLNILPDWDMFQTVHPYSAFHAAARCVSGGPIYITDEPGNHDVDLISQMTATNPRGQTVILRPSVIGKTLDFYNDYNEEHILKIGTFNGAADTGTGILGLFNIGEREMCSLIPLTDFPGIERTHNNSRLYIVRAHTNGQISSILPGPSGSDKISLSAVALPVRGYEILTAYPLQVFTMPSRHDRIDPSPTYVAVLGLIGKMTGAAGIASSDIYIADNSRLHFNISLKALGVLGIFISDLPGRSITNDFMITILGRPIPVARVAKGEQGGGKVLETDVGGAWEDMQLEAGWSNEVEVQVFMADRSD